MNRVEKLTMSLHHRLAAKRRVVTKTTHWQAAKASVGLSPVADASFTVEVVAAPGVAAIGPVRCLRS